MARLSRGKNVIIVIGADDKSGNVLDKAKLGLKDLESSGKRASSGVRDLRRSWIAATAAAAAFAATVSKIMAAYAEQERVEKRLRFALQAQGLEVRKNQAHLLEYASALQQMSIYGDEAIIPIQQLLLQIGGLSGDVLDRATKATLDFASAWGVDLKSAATQVAKAATGYTSALTRYGIVVDNSLSDSEKFVQALDQMEQKFGGTAQSDVDTFAGQVSQLKNNFGDLAEEVGAMNSGVLTTAVRKWNDWARAATDAIARVNEQANASEDTLIENMIGKLERELRGEGEYDEFIDEFGNVIQAKTEVSIQRASEILSKISRLKDRLTFLKESPESPLVKEPAAPTIEAGGEDKTPPVGGLIKNYVAAQAAAWDAMQELEIRKGAEFLELQQTRESARIQAIADAYDMEQQMAIEQGEALIAIQQQQVEQEKEMAAMKIEAARMGFEALATAFPQFKAAAIAEATIRGGVAFMNALSVQPWWVGLAQAAVAAAKTKAAIDNIKKTGIRTGGGTSSYSYGGAAGTVPQGLAVQASPNVTINIPEGSRVYTAEEIAQISVLGLEQHLKETGNMIGELEINVITGG